MRRMPREGWVTRQDVTTAVKSITLLLALGFTGVAFGQTPEPWFSLAITVPQTVVKVGSNIDVDVAKKNISDHDIQYAYHPGFLGVGYDILVTNSSGDAMGEGQFVHTLRTRVGHGGGAISEMIGTLKPHETLHQSFAANLLRDMTHPGKYTIQISQTVYASQADLKAGRKIVVQSNKVTVTVTN